MTVLAKLFEHNHWANLRILEACASLGDDQLDAQPRSVTKGTIRETLSHLVRSQQKYLRHITRVEPPFVWDSPPPMEVLRESLTRSGQGFLEIASDESGRLPKARLQSRDGTLAEPWVIMLQAINHAAEHREQISSMLTDLGVQPPGTDGWDFAAATGAMDPVTP